MKLPDTAVVLRQTANPTQDDAAFHHRARETLADYGSGFLARQFDGRPSVGSVELCDEQQGSLFKNAVRLIGKIKNLHARSSSSRSRSESLRSETKQHGEDRVPRRMPSLGRAGGEPD